MKKISLFFTALLTVAGLSLSISTAQGAIDALNFSSVQQEETYHQLTQELRCPQCQNNNIADSNATIAVDMRGKVFELLQKGKQKQEIIDYMVERYGNFVTYNPPLTTSTLILWLAPALLLIMGFLMLFKRKNKTQLSADSEPLSEQESQRLQDLLNNKDK